MRIVPAIKNASSELNTRDFSVGKESKSISEKHAYLAGLAGIILLSLIFTSLLSVYGLKEAVLMLVLIIGLPAAIMIIALPRFGVIVLLIAAYFIMWIIKMGLTDFQLGTLIDAIEALLIFGFFLKQKFNPNWDIFKTPVAIVILLWEAYALLQFANPTTESRMAWVYTVRSVAGVTLMYFIFSYHIKTISFVRTLLNLWLILCFLGALNAFKQEYFGFFPFESANFNDPAVQQLLFINGEWRKFSIFSDPVAFSYNMAIGTIFCFCMVASTHTSVKKKVLFIILGIFFTTTMLYSATRASYVLMPAAMAFYVILNMSRKVLAFGIVAAMCMLVVINIPTSNVTLYRFQSAFKPSDDASFNVRAINQKKMIPYIQTHPFGGGLGATGVWGVKFAPHSILAQVPPDSGYFRVALELGWIGLFLFCSLFFIILRQGIINFFKIKDPELKAYCLAMCLIVFALNVGSYPQEAIVQYPTSIYFFFFVSLINITLKLDQEKQLQRSLSLETK